MHQEDIVLRLTFLWIGVLTLLPAGCLPATRVVKNPGEHDRGVRYYRPKPYLMVQPMIDDSGRPVEGYVTLESEMLPDFSEEYSIHVRSGLGTNETAISLHEGWRLESLNVSLDSQFDENLEAISELAGEIPAMGARGAVPDQMPVRATNVPLGYYESVVSRGRDGKKRLYGFRYVGFMPYSSCPLESCGAKHQSCYAATIYGLMFDGEAMVFRPLHEQAAGEAMAGEAMAESEEDAATGEAAERPSIVAEQPPAEEARVGPDPGAFAELPL